MPTDDSAAPPLRIERFDPQRHDVSAFDCGALRLNNYLRFTAKKRQAADMARTYVVCAAAAPSPAPVLGYHAINVGRMTVDALARPPRDAPRHGEIPVLFLGQVAVALTAQNQGLGRILMHHVFAKATAIAEIAGCYALLLDVMADDGRAAFEKRRDWYAAFGFTPFPSDEARMFMTMDQLRALTAAAP